MFLDRLGLATNTANRLSTEKCKSLLCYCGKKICRTDHAFFQWSLSIDKRTTELPASATKYPPSLELNLKKHSLAPLHASTHFGCANAARRDSQVSLRTVKLCYNASAEQHRLKHKTVPAIMLKVAFDLLDLPARGGQGWVTISRSQPEHIQRSKNSSDTA